MLLKTVFGTYYKDNNGKFRNVEEGDYKSGEEYKTELASNQVMTEEDIAREAGIGKTIFRTNRAIKAVDDPLTYLKDKADDLEKIKKKLVEKYNEIIPGYLSRYDDETAKKKAMAEVQYLKSKLMDDHRYLYPTSIKDDGLNIANVPKKETVEIK